MALAILLVNKALVGSVLQLYYRFYLWVVCPAGTHPIS
ncbi:hypothetical protein Thicy_1034 [Thiomicrospira cyclica ALM1]|uniref:Uncharacterized protein n=1 Tax=Thiomicrospira cyclica (strain DSM 14477 / JCM 11371 / ALM1) TaxID=717773 RepID=F6D8F0_THICA|nr:hypothetical protein Thicy_1034 [Thiomicrospira cyclica ALM1]